jgi:hypothetical protein
MNEKEYTKITYDYVVSIVSALQSGDVAKHHGDKDPFRFVFISGAGANPTEWASKPMFACIKVSFLPLLSIPRLTAVCIQGRTKRLLLNLSNDSKIKSSVLRPGYFFPT